MHPRHQGKKLSDLPPGSVIGTSALRRAAQLRRNYPHLTIENIVSLDCHLLANDNDNNNIKNNDIDIFDMNSFSPWYVYVIEDFSFRKYL